MTDDFPPWGKDRTALIAKWDAEDERLRREGHHPTIKPIDDRFLLIEETKGASYGNVYIVRGDHGHLAWSPSWRSEVTSRVTQIGQIGRATCIAWSGDAILTPALRAPRILGECGPDLESIEALMLASGVKLRPSSEPPPTPVTVSFPRHITVNKDSRAIRNP